MTSEDRPPKTYTGCRGPRGIKVLRSDGTALPLRLDLRPWRPYSYTGFGWGRGNSSGAAHLALALLADYLEDDARALDLYYFLKSEVIERIEGDEWTLAPADIEAALWPTRILFS